MQHLFLYSESLMYILPLFGGPAPIHSLVLASTAVIPLAIEYIFESNHLLANKKSIKYIYFVKCCMISRLFEFTTQS